MTKLSRRDALRAAAAGVGAIVAAAASHNDARADVAANASPAMVEGAEAWKYAVVDPKKVADDAYENYGVGRCMHTTFRAIVANVADALEEKDPLAAREIASFPFHMMRYGSSGANGFGTLCGAVNAAMAAVGLFVSDSDARKAILNEIGRYYERTMLPVYVPKDADPSESYPQTIANSLLCHISSGKWVELAQVKSNSPERTERCSRLSADLARKTVELLNANFAALNSPDVAPVVSLKRTEPTATCVSCHDKSGTNADTIGTMTCSECHPEKTVDHHEK